MLKFSKSVLVGAARKANTHNKSLLRRLDKAQSRMMYGHNKRNQSQAKKRNSNTKKRTAVDRQPSRSATTPSEPDIGQEGQDSGTE